MFSIFNTPRRYPRIYAPYYDAFNFYDGREKWIASTKDAPKEAVILYALHWLHLEVYNGGFWQYFYNSTGTSYPEAVEGFRAIGMSDVASIVTNAAAKLGEPYPFDFDHRREIVGDPQNRMDFDGFDTKFYALADTDRFFRKLPKFVPYAETFANEFESENLRPLFATPQQAVDFVDRGRTATEHHGKQTLRASGNEPGCDSNTAISEDSPLVSGNQKSHSAATL